jgi:hypothetical protein
LNLLASAPLKSIISTESLIHQFDPLSPKSSWTMVIALPILFVPLLTQFLSQKKSWKRQTFLLQFQSHLSLPRRKEMFFYLFIYLFIYLSSFFPFISLFVF